ncbi:unnamed protein product [Mytilus coruscus]|uniref:B box-type domain-containing protein n=1 Tax=Mytilus coruscus TaxID=42192 RepID=A0A6J8CZY3_MYTCO|nr:unnamed protein product [Mytilus coruscus]
MAQSASKTCEICVCSPGHNYCEQCDQLFCDGCKVSHLRSKIATNHTFLSGPSVIPEVKQYCKEHNESFIYYCMECDMPICKICVIKNHKSHNFAEIKESTEEIKAEVKEVIEMKIRNLQSNIAGIEQSSNKYKADICNVIKVISEEAEQLILMIKEKIKCLIMSLREKETQKIQTLQSLDNEFKTGLEKAKKQHKLYEDTQQITDTTKMLKQLKQIKSQIDAVEENPVPAIPFVKYANKMVSRSEI